MGKPANAGTTDERICPTCRTPIPADAPAGICPRCALGVGLGGGASTNAATSPGDPDPSPSLQELARRLPDYADFEPIGRGGMGTVYRARHRRLDRPVAIKVIGPESRGSAAFGERFRREARALARLSHPNIVAVHDFGERDGLFYLVMELVDGVTLRHTLETGALEPAEALSIVPRICDALQYAHDQGVVHRDIKPENILIDRAGTVKIADFGLAKLADDGTRARLTATAQVMGTPHYMAPEQVERPGDVDHRADIFALGVVFYEMLTGELPVGRFPPPSARVEVDVRLDRVVLRTLEKEPRLRYQRASELKTDVESLASEADEPDERPADPRTPDAGYRRRGYEFRSAASFWGLPLLHIRFSRSGMGVARGLIAIGDMAVGGFAVGGLAFGGFAVGGLAAGLLAMGGLSLGLLVAVGGLSVGALAFGGQALGLVATGVVDRQYLALDPPTARAVQIAVWLVSSIIVTSVVGTVIVVLTRRERR